MAETLVARGVEIQTGARVRAIRRAAGVVELETDRGATACRRFINCAGLYSDAVARLAGVRPEARIIPFRGEYYLLRPERRLVRGLIYPVPDPALPFLGVHLTKRIDGGVLAGPNAVLALKREGYRRSDVSLTDLKDLLAFRGFWRMARRHWRSAAREAFRSSSRSAFLRALRRLAPDLRGEDLRPAGSGVRAQAVDGEGRLVDDFRIVPAGRMIHVLNVPSPAATAALAIGRTIVETLAATFGLGGAR
jgi:L-2-hydroxyglutarate oxidase